MTDHSGMKLGKQTARHDPRTLQLGNYLRLETLPPPPPTADWSDRVQGWGMMRNDAIGDCTCAAAGHLIMEWTANAGKEIVPSDADIVKAYSAITGYDPATGKNDNGAVEIDVLNYWRSTGIAGHKIFAYAALEPGNHDHVRDAVWLFGDCYIGLSLPVTAQKQTVWTVPPGGPVGPGAPGSWGGHAVPVIAYDAAGLVVVTWGALKRMTWSFWAAYCDEAYAVFSADWMNAKKVSPDHLDMATLEHDLHAIAG